MLFGVLTKFSNLENNCENTKRRRRNSVPYKINDGLECSRPKRPKSSEDYTKFLYRNQSKTSLPDNNEHIDLFREKDQCQIHSKKLQTLQQEEEQYLPEEHLKQEHLEKQFLQEQQIQQEQHLQVEQQLQQKQQLQHDQQLQHEQHHEHQLQTSRTGLVPIQPRPHFLIRHPTFPLHSNQVLFY